MKKITLIINTAQNSPTALRKDKLVTDSVSELKK